MIDLKWRINAYLTIAIIILGMGAVSVLAADRNAEYMDACRPELSQHYGQGMDIGIVSKILRQSLPYWRCQRELSKVTLH